VKYFITVAGVLVALACTALSTVAYRGCSLGRDPFNQRIFANTKETYTRLQIDLARKRHERVGKLNFRGSRGDAPLRRTWPGVIEISYPVRGYLIQPKCNSHISEFLFPIYLIRDSNFDRIGTGVYHYRCLKTPGFKTRFKCGWHQP